EPLEAGEDHGRSPAGAARPGGIQERPAHSKGAGTVPGPDRRRAEV
ncbi:uncharacterized protein METZ01_LOCUS216497, partial [marine metagenome]